MKYASIGLALLLVSSILALSLVSAQDAEETTQIVSNNISSDLPNSDQIAESASEVALNKTNKKQIGLTRVTYAQGWATSENTGYLSNLVWASSSYSNITQNDIKAVREQYKNDKKGARMALADNVSQGGVMKLSSGRLTLGTGREATIYKLTNKDFSNTSLTFDVYSLDKNSSSIGTLTLNAKQYGNMTLWSGKLVINSGDKAGSYDVSYSAESRLTAMSAGNGKAKGIEIAMEKGNGKKIGLFQKVFNFGRNKK